ncbi:MAG: stage III sporulation protein AB [Christensenellales bacterium]
MKLIMCAAVIAVCAALGRQFSARMIQRLLFFREYQSALTYLSDKVVGLNIELCKALKACDNDCVQPFFDACAAALRETPQLSLKSIWRECLSDFRSRLSFLTKEDMRFLNDGGAAAEALCANPSERQAALYLKRLGAHLDFLETEKNKKCRIYNMAGLLGGLMIALLVI